MKEIQEFPTPQKDYYKVYVRTVTYNQSQYIEDCLNGVAMQKTNFSFVHQVVDDASTDGEQEVIRAWLNRECSMDKAEYYENDICTISIAKSKNNSNYTVAAYFLKKNLFKEPKKKEPLFKLWRNACPYEALCEGDDYWTCPEKLQKQFNMLEEHPEYSLCHHNYMIWENGALRERNANIPHEQDLLSITENNTVSSLTMFYRNYNEPLIPPDFPFKYHVYQFFYNLRLAEKGKIVYIDEPMAVYRVNQGGIFSMQSPRRQYLMTIGNLINMIDWYTVGVKRPDVVEILKKRARRLSIGFIKGSILRFSIHDLITFFKVYRHFWI